MVNKWCLFQKSDFKVSLTFGTWSNFGANRFVTFDARNLYSSFWKGSVKFDINGKNTRQTHAVILRPHITYSLEIEKMSFFAYFNPL